MSKGYKFDLKYSQLAIIDAYKNGYRVVNGNVFKNGNPVKTKTNNDGYISIYYLYNHKPFAILVSRIVAYQKYKLALFKPKIQVRHLDGNCTNNLESNIAIGTSSVNNYDKSPEIRKKSAEIARSYRGSYNYAQVYTLHMEGKSVLEIMNITGIKWRGTVNVILNKVKNRLAVTELTNIKSSYSS